MTICLLEYHLKQNFKILIQMPFPTRAFAQLQVPVELPVCLFYIPEISCPDFVPKTSYSD
jgi:hypothetical protein